MRANVIKTSEVKKFNLTVDSFKVEQAILQYIQRVVNVAEQIMKLVGRSNMNSKFVETALDIVGRPFNYEDLCKVEEKPILVKANIKALVKMDETCIGKEAFKFLNQLATALMQFYVHQAEFGVFEDPIKVLFTPLPTSNAKVPGFTYDQTRAIIPTPDALNRVKSAKPTNRKRARVGENAEEEEINEAEKPKEPKGAKEGKAEEA